MARKWAFFLSQGQEIWVAPDHHAAGFACFQNLPTTPPGRASGASDQTWATWGDAALASGSSLPWHPGNCGPQRPTVPLEATHPYLKVLRVAGERERQAEPELERLREQGSRRALLGGLW